MKRTFLSFIISLLAISLSAQEAREIISPIMSKEKGDFYAQQTKAWAKEVARTPNSEHAWRNYYEAAHYVKWYDGSDTTSTVVLRQMKQAIPDTYTYYYCVYRDGYSDTASFQAAEKALSMMPSDCRDYDTWLGYLAITGQFDKVKKMARRYYESGTYSPSVMQYNYNELQGMSEGGIFVGNGDAVLIPKMLLQYGMGLHRDKLIILYSALCSRQYVDSLFQRLGIGERPKPSKEFREQKDYDDYSNLLLQTIAQRTGRPLYFSVTTSQDILAPWKNHLYNEGMTLRYSLKPYDNRTVKLRNVEQRYLLEYLHQTFYPNTWSSADNLSSNYAVMLSDLLPYYRTHSPERYSWLKSLLIDAVSHTTLPLTRKDELLKFVNQ